MVQKLILINRVSAVVLPFLSIFLSNQVLRTEAVAIDNNIIGEPQVQCSDDTITFSVRTRNLFNGNIFIKGKYNSAACKQEYSRNSFGGASFTVRIGECGMQRIRQLQPNGMNYIIVFVVNFHSQFITKVDRAYNVRCFYAQVDKTVTSQLEVSMISTTELQAGTMLMPNCLYSVRSDTLNGPQVRYARVGDRLVHRWECDNPNYGMLVKNCFVNDGTGVSVRVLDARGCPVFTPVVQGNLNYDQSLNLAYVEVWAYKFPDRGNLYFQCQIQICNKRENECIGVTPPNCPLVTKNEFTGSAGVIGTPGFNTGPTPVYAGVNQPSGNDAYPYGPGSAPVIGGPSSYGNNAGVFGGQSTSGLIQPGYPYGFIPGSAPVIGGPTYNNAGVFGRTSLRQHETPVSGATSQNDDSSPLSSVLGGRRTASIEEGTVTPQNFTASTSAGRKRREADMRKNASTPSPKHAESETDPNEVLDVLSESLMIIDLENGEFDEGVATSGFERSIHAVDGDAVCLEPLRLGLLMSAFVVMASIITGLLIYIAYSKNILFASLKKSRERPCCQLNNDSVSVCSSLRSSVSSGHASTTPITSSGGKRAYNAS